MEWVQLFSSATEGRQRIQPGRPQLLIVHGHRICLIRQEEKWLAVQDRCTHNGESLSKGTINYLGEVICPWHGYRFDLRTGRESAERSSDLITYPMKEDEGGIFIGL